MKKLADFIVDKRYYVIVFFLIITGICLFLSTKVNINYDITKYLPKDSETRIGMDIMDNEFEKEDTSNLYVMFSDVTGHEMELLKELKAIKGVSSVDYDDSESYNKDDYTLYILNVDDYADSKIAKEVYDTVNENYSDYKIALSGTINEENKPVLHMWIVFTAIFCAMIILIIMCNSYVEPFLFLFTIGLAVLINKGTNIMFDSVSNITDSICAVLQMALSMDYSIMLMNRYTQEKAKTKDKLLAMKNALQNAFGSISSSSITTIVGMMSLVFMSFTIGKDLGFVLAKGVLLSLICIFFVLPGLILMFDNIITKTKKKSLSLKLDGLGRASYALRYVALALIIIVFGVSYALKGNLKILYTAEENDKVASVFKENNQMAIIYNNDYEQQLANICKNIDAKEVDQVVCYGNTIDEKLEYIELKDKLNTLGTNVKIDNYLLKLIYYNYYAGNIDNTISLKELVDFIEKVVYTNNELKSRIDSSVKDNINKLKYFADPTEIEKVRNTSELANILGIDEDSLNNLLIYYHSKNINNALSINEVINFINSDILNNKTFSSSINNDTRNSLNTLSKFIDKNTLYTEYDSNTLADIFGIDKNSMSNLYLYYYSINGVDTTLTMHEFSSFILENVVNNENYSNMFSTDAINSLKLLNTLSDTTSINSTFDATNLSTLMGISEDKVKSILLLMNMSNNSDTTLTMKEFLDYTNYIKSNTTYLDGIDLTSLQALEIFINNENEIDTTKLDKATLTTMFKSIDSSLVDNVYTALGLSDDTTFSPLEFTTLIVNNLETYMDATQYKSIVMLNNIIKASVNSTKYSKEELALLLNMDTTNINSIYLIIDSLNNKFMSSPKSFINFLVSNLDNESIKNSIDDTTKASLMQAYQIINNAEVKMDYSTMSNTTNIDISTVRSLYALSSKDCLKLNKVNLINFILEHKNDSRLSVLDSNTLEKLMLLKNVITGVENDTRYNYSGMSNLLGIDSNNLSLLYSYYDIKNGYKQTISLKQLVHFILSDVVNNPKFNSSIDLQTKNKLETITTIMTDSLINVEYTSNELYNKLSKITDGLDAKLFDLIYLYFGSENDYKNSYKLTVEEFVNYLNNNILKDDRFSDFLSSEIKSKITSSKDKINDAKKLLVGDNYSRVVINTNFELEEENTFSFIKDLKKNVNKVGDDVYLIGNSPMAYDLNKSFGSEFNFISLLTMLLIFIVVAITFKSFIVPFILTLIIQCAVYITMGILSIFGGSVYFIALLIVQSILMGATIDYAILFTSYYKEFRQTYNKKGSLINAYNQSIHTILTSASVLIIVTFIVGFFASAIAAKICMTISQGTLCSTILVLFILPAVLAALDKFIVKKN